MLWGHWKKIGCKNSIMLLNTLEYIYRGCQFKCFIWIRLVCSIKHFALHVTLSAHKVQPRHFRSKMPYHEMFNTPHYRYIHSKQLLCDGNTSWNKIDHFEIGTGNSWVVIVSDLRPRRWFRADITDKHQSDSMLSIIAKSWWVHFPYSNIWNWQMGSL